MKIVSAELETVVGITTPDLPIKHLPEAALLGRSNVGKSSLINAVAGRKRLAYTSSQPGKTQTMNYYRLNDSLYLVDLPGYGFAKNTAENRKAWGRMIETYLNLDEMLSYVFLLVDSRHAPTDQDKKMYDYLLYLYFDPVIILTKADKVSPAELQENIDRARDALGAGEDTVLLPFSAATGEGVETFRDFLSQILENERG